MTMNNNVTEYKSIKSNSTYTVTIENGRAYLGVTGEAATNSKVITEKERIRKSGGDEVEIVKWIARKLSNTY